MILLFKLLLLTGPHIYTSVHKCSKGNYSACLTGWSPARDGQKYHIKYPNCKALYKQPPPLTIWQLHWPLEEQYLRVTSDTTCFIWLLVHFSSPCSPHCPQTSCTLRPASVSKYLRLNDSRHWQVSSSTSVVSTQNRGTIKWVRFYFPRLSLPPLTYTPEKY